MKHKFKWIIYEGDRVAIDAEIVPLITKLWKLGIKTTSSCQALCSFNCDHKWKKNKNDYQKINSKNCYSDIWLCFNSSEDLEKLYNIVAEYSKDNKSMYNKMGCDRVIYDSGLKFKRIIDCWEFLFIMDNRGIEGHWGRPTFGKKQSTQLMWIEDKCSKNNFVISPQITFPRKHLSYVEEKLQLAIGKIK